MENKKLLKYLLNDLIELDDLLTEHSDNCFDQMEMEFIRNRVKGAKKLMQMYIGQENMSSESVNTGVSMPAPEPVTVKEIPVVEVKEIIPPAPVPVPEVVEIKAPVVEVVEEVKTVKLAFTEPEREEEPKESEKEAKDENDGALNMPMTEDFQGPVIERIATVLGNTIEAIAADEDETEMQKTPVIENNKQPAKPKITAVQQELKLEDEAPSDQNKRLGDSFSKEKSVNDIMSDDGSKLEHKLSNRPVTTLQSVIGINDRFQYVRELFEGSNELYNKTVTELDAMNDLKEAVAYLQQNFKWKKTETSLKFVNLIKRRFPNE